MTIEDVLVGTTTVRVLTSQTEHSFDRDGQRCRYQGNGRIPNEVIEAVESHGFEVKNSEWPKQVTVEVHDEARQQALDLFPDRDDAFHVAKGMGTFVGLTYRVEETGENTLLSAESPEGGQLVRVADEPREAAFNDIWSAYTEDVFGNPCELYIPDDLTPDDYEEVGYMEKSRRSKNERTSWSQFFDFYTWLVKNGYAVVPVGRE